MNHLVDVVASRRVVFLQVDVDVLSTLLAEEIASSGVKVKVNFDLRPQNLAIETEKNFVHFSPQQEVENESDEKVGDDCRRHPLHEKLRVELH